MSDDLITIGRIIKVLGLKGEVKVLSLTHNPERFRKLLSVFIVSPQGKGSERRIRGVRSWQGRVILSFEGISTSGEASGLLNHLIKIPEKDLDPLPDGEYYIFQLIGFTVYTDEGEDIGTLTDVLSTGSNDVYVVKKGEKEYLIPAIKDVIKEIDMKGRRMVIHPMKGLLD
ncbi:MAG: ribosome maturation factor RimM [Nitrospirota bacterium]